MKAVIVLLVFVGGLWTYNEYFKGKAPNKELASTAGPAIVSPSPSAEPTEQLDISSISQIDYTVTLYSTPDKARVILNGEDTGEFTPVRKTFKANTPFNLRLAKEGYTDLVTTITPTYEAYTFTGTMQRLPKVASLIINIVNGGANPELRIDGVPVAIKPKGGTYLVQAGAGVKIQAFNKTTGLSAESTVNVPENQRRMIDLFLR